MNERGRCNFIHLDQDTMTYPCCVVCKDYKYIHVYTHAHTCSNNLDIHGHLPCVSALSHNTTDSMRIEVCLSYTCFSASSRQTQIQYAHPHSVYPVKEIKAFSECCTLALQMHANMCTRANTHTRTHTYTHTYTHTHTHTHTHSGSVVKAGEDQKAQPGPLAANRAIFTPVL